MNVSEYRKAKGYTQKEMASLLGIGEKAYGHKERGIRSFTVEELLKLEIILEVSISDLFKDKKNKAQKEVRGKYV